MKKRLVCSLGLALLFCLSVGKLTLAASGSGSPAPDVIPLSIALSFLLPAGLILLSVAAFSEKQTVSAATGAVIAWGLAVLAYFAVGFAFQFGGIAVVHDDPQLAGLFMEYSLLDVSWGIGWGMIGLKGFFLSGAASTEGALALFLSQLPLLGVAALIPFFAIWGQSRPWVIGLSSLLMGAVIYPILGNWVWGGGWLANLGTNMGHGHGFVDAGGSGQMMLTGAAVALAALLVLRPDRKIRKVRSQNDVSAHFVAETGQANPAIGSERTDNLLEHSLAQPMPQVHLPLLGWLGSVLMAVGWMAVAYLAHIPTAGNVSPVPMAVNLALAAFGGALSAGLYAWFTTGRPDVLMSARGLVAGLVVVAAGAPFLPAWAALFFGLLIGLVLPIIVFVFEKYLNLNDIGAALANFAIPASIGLLLPGVLANGRQGIGWNGVGADAYLGVEGQGVSALLVSSGMTPDWPGQMTAQLIGTVAIFAWSFGLSWLVFALLVGTVRAWQRSGLEIGTPPPPVEFDSPSPLPESDPAAQEENEEDTSPSAMTQPTSDVPLTLTESHED